MNPGPRQNRVNPWGEIIAVPDRGALTGNRGVIHDAEGRITREFRLKRWIACRLEFKGRHREIMRPGRWTELFFLDEATAFAAGHRPCAECRRADYNAFREAWASAEGLADAPRADWMDERLHAERLDPADDAGKRTYEAAAGELPDGTFAVGIASRSDRTPHLLGGGRWLAWSPGGYSDAGPADAAGRVLVLTPRSSVAAIAAGYAPEIG